MKKLKIYCMVCFFLQGLIANSSEFLFNKTSNTYNTLPHPDDTARLGSSTMNSLYPPAYNYFDTENSSVFLLISDDDIREVKKLLKNQRREIQSIRKGVETIIKKNRSTSYYEYINSFVNTVYKKVEKAICYIAYYFLKNVL